MDYITNIKNYLVKIVYNIFGYDYVYFDYNHINNVKMLEYTISDEEIDKLMNECNEELNNRKVKELEYTFFCLDMETRYNKLIKDNDDNLNENDNNGNNNDGALHVKKRILLEK